MIMILFVCTGNICRSPTAEGVFRDIAAAEGRGTEVEADSAGTHGYHVGDPPDPRTIEAAAARGFDLSALRARRVSRDDFHRFDFILSMDRGHFAHLEAMRPVGARAAVKLFLDYHPSGSGTATPKDVPDPYYGGPQGFAQVLDLVELTSRSLLRMTRI
jgi:protein-tyrosine phosphatase